MKYRWLIRSCISVMLVAAMVAGALWIATAPTGSPPTRLLFISGGTSDTWQGIVAGAEAAARDLGIELQVRTPTADNCPDQQAAILRAIDLADYDGVAFCPADPETQLELVNEIAEQTKLITIGNYYFQSKALCHIGFFPSGVACRIADLILSELPQGGKILLMSSRSKSSRNSIADKQLNEFKEQWAEWCGPGTSIVRSIVVDFEDNGRMTRHTASVLAALEGPDLAFIFALDSPSVDAALSLLAGHPRPTPPRIIAVFDFTAVILDSVDHGRIYAAISEAPYRQGYEGVKRAANLCQCKAASTLPIPGYGSICIPSEIVQRSNLAVYQRRAQARST